MTQTRRQFLATTAAASATFSLPGIARAADLLATAMIVPSPVADVGWSHSLALGMEAVKAKLGSSLTILENIQEGPDADRIMQKAVTDGAKFVLAGSFGYMNGALQLARRFPDISVIHASGYQTAPNLSNFAARYYLGTYLLGMAAASLTKSKKLGSVSAFAIPELITSLNAFLLGAQSIDPEIELSVVWVNSWFDPAKEQDAAKALMAQGCDVVFSNAQDTPSVISACEAAGVHVMNLNSSMKAYAPKFYLGCVNTDWSPYFIAEAEAHVAGTFTGASHWLGIREGVVSVIDLSPDIPADVKAKIDEVEAQIAAGSFSPFTGPLAKADGTEFLAAGEVIADDVLLGMDFHVKGVSTPLPQQ